MERCSPFAKAKADMDIISIILNSRLQRTPEFFLFVAEEEEEGEEEEKGQSHPKETGRRSLRGFGRLPKPGAALLSCPVGNQPRR